MKKLGILLSTVGLFLFCLIASAKPLQFVIEDYSGQPPEVNVQKWQNITQAIKQVLQKDIVAVDQQKVSISDDTAIAYMKTATAANIKNMAYLATAVTNDPVTKKDSTHYDAHLIVTKKSHIKTLKDLNGKTMVYYSDQSTSNYIKIKDQLEKNGIKVTWIKVNSPTDALNAVLGNDNYAVSVWDYPYENLSQKQKDDLSIIQTTKDLKNPGLYVTKLVSQDQQNKLLAVLANIKGPYDIVGFKK